MLSLLSLSAIKALVRASKCVFMKDGDNIFLRRSPLPTCAAPAPGRNPAGGDRAAGEEKLCLVLRGILNMSGPQAEDDNTVDDDKTVKNSKVSSSRPLRSSISKRPPAPASTPVVKYEPLGTCHNILQHTHTHACLCFCFFLCLCMCKCFERQWHGAGWRGPGGESSMSVRGGMVRQASTCMRAKTPLRALGGLSRAQYYLVFFVLESVIVRQCVSSGRDQRHTMA